MKYGMGRTYCVTKNGKIISYRVDDLCFLEGCIDQSEMTDYSNLAILIKSTDELAVSSFLRQYKTKYSGLPIKQKYTDYMANIETRDCLFETSINAKNGNISELLPQDINYRLKEFFRHVIEDAMNLDVTKLSLVAPEIKLMRNIEIADTFEVQPGLYLIGAATGKFRGILQSLCSGMQCVHNILRG